MNTQNLTKTIEVRGHTEAKSYHIPVSLCTIYTQNHRGPRPYLGKVIYHENLFNL